MDEIHRTYRISVRLIDGSWSARITHAKGFLVPIHARASCVEGEAVCFGRAQEAVDRYIAYLSGRGSGSAG